MNTKQFGCPEAAIPGKLADRNCRKCFGRGWSGRYGSGDVAPCSCVLKRTKRLHAEAIAKAAKESGK